MDPRRKRWAWTVAALALAATAFGWAAWPDPDLAAIQRVQAEFGAVFEGRVPSSVVVETRWFPRLIDEWLKPETLGERASRGLLNVCPRLANTALPFPVPCWRRQAASAMALVNSADSRAALPLLMARWPTVPWGMRGDVARSIARLVDSTDATDLAFVLELSVDPDSGVRAAAADALKKFAPDHRDARAALSRLENDQVAPVREHAGGGYE